MNTLCYLIKLMPLFPCCGIYSSFVALSIFAALSNFCRIFILLPSWGFKLFFLGVYISLVISQDIPSCETFSREGRNRTLYMGKTVILILFAFEWPFSAGLTCYFQCLYGVSPKSSDHACKYGLLQSSTYSRNHCRWQLLPNTSVRIKWGNQFEVLLCTNRRALAVIYRFRWRDVISWQKWSTHYKK